MTRLLVSLVMNNPNILQVFAYWGMIALIIAVRR